MSAIGQLGMETANNAVGALMGLALEKHNDKRQIKQQQKLTDMQVSANRNLTQFNFDKQLEMWNKTNYGAQMQHLKEAGLNPGLLYGMGGAGGATTGGGSGSVSGASAPTGGGEVMGMMMQKSQLQLMEAQKENIQAQTDKTKVETTKTAGVDTELAQTQIKDLLQGIENKKAQEMLTEVQTDLANVDKMFKTQGFDASLAKLKYETNIALQTLNILRNDAIISEETWSTKIDMVQSEAAGILLRNSLTKSQTELTEQQIQGIIQSIKTQVRQLQQGDRALSQKDKDIIIDQERNKLIETGIWVGGASNIIGSAVDIFTKGKKPTYNDNRKTYYLER